MVSVVAVQVRSLLGAVKTRHLKAPIVHRDTCTTVSTGEEGRRSIVQYVLPRIVPNADRVALMVRARSVQELQLSGSM